MILKFLKNLFSPEPKLCTGTVERVEYTYGGAGNQWTTIDGKRYATYTDWNNPETKGGLIVGTIVEFTTCRDWILQYNFDSTTHAKTDFAIIKRVL